MNYISLYVMFLIIILFTQCKEDIMVEEEVIVEEQEPDCREIEELVTGNGYLLYPQTYPFHTDPYFNPNNSDEIVFLDSDNFPNVDLVKYNIKTNENQVLFQGSFGSKPRWGRNGWILFTLKEGQNYNVHKIRDNGEDLTKISTYPYCFGAKWDIESENIIYKLGFTSPTQSLLVTENGNVLDTLYLGGDGDSWQHPIYMAIALSDGLWIYNPNDATEFELSLNLREHISEPEYIVSSLMGAEWLDEEQIIWCHASGVYLTNIVTKETHKIRENCVADFLQQPTYTPDINKVVFEHIQRIEEPKGSDSGYQTVSFYMMNPDGTDGETIEIDLN